MATGGICSVHRRWLSSPIAAVVASAVLGALTSRGLADAAGTEPIEVDFVAHQGCGDGDAFFGEIRGRTAKVRRPTPGEAVRRVRVRIARVGEKSVGLISWNRPLWNGRIPGPRVAPCVGGELGAL